MITLAFKIETSITFSPKLEHKYLDFIIAMHADMLYVHLDSKDDCYQLRSPQRHASKE